MKILIKIYKMNKVGLVLFCSIFIVSCATQKDMKKKKLEAREVVLVADSTGLPFNYSEPIYKVGIALSGGGGRGFAHAGVLRAMDELGIKPQIIAGTSAGSIAGALYASGVAPNQMLDAFRRIRFIQVPRFRIFGSKDTVEDSPNKQDRYIFLKTHNLARILEANIPVRTFEELKIPLVVNATKMASGQNIYFTKGELIRPVVASSAVPMLFRPVNIDGYDFVDGGVMQNLPVLPIRKACKYVIAVDVNPIEDFSAQNKIVGSEWERVFKLMIRANTLRDKDAADLFIQPLELINFNIFDTKHGEEMYWIGYNAAKHALEKFVKEHPDILEGN